MAQYIERPLKDKNTEAFLKSRGFTLVPHVSRSAWLNFNTCLYLTADDVILDDSALYKVIYDMAYQDGKTEGKVEAVSTIQQMIYATVFPPELKNVEDEPTYA